MSDTTRRGRFVWYDLMTSDAAKAKEFYTKVIGWGTQVWEGPAQYTMWTANGAPLGGLMQMPPNAGPSHWLGYVATPDVEQLAKDGESRGGRTLVKPTDIPTVGRYAVLSDPQGATYAGFTPLPSSQGPSDGPPARGQFSWHELATTNFDDALAFYRSQFGWEKIADHDMGPMGIYRIFGRNGTQMGGMFNKPAQMPGPPSWLYYVMVDSATAAVDRVKTSGGQVLNGPMEVPGGDWIAQCVDPQGGAFAVQSRGK
jgi:predicted enzyme related to lactoylglutathione lyase